MKKHAFYNLGYANAPERPPAVRQDRGQSPRLRSGVAFGLLCVAGRGVAADDPGSYRLWPPHPFLRNSKLLAPAVWHFFFFLPKGQRLISQVQVLRTCPASSPEVTSTILRHPWEAGCLGLLVPEPARAVPSSLRCLPEPGAFASHPPSLSPSLSPFLSFLLYFPLPLSPLKFPAP